MITVPFACRQTMSSDWQSIDQPRLVASYLSNLRGGLPVNETNLTRITSQLRLM